MNKNFVVLSWLMGCDVATTRIGLALGASEANPFWNMDYMLWIKATALVIAGILMLWLTTTQLKWMQRFSIAGMGVVVVNNAYIIANA